jgi:hypothetical protein
MLGPYIRREDSSGRITQMQPLLEDAPYDQYAASRVHQSRQESAFFQTQKNQIQNQYREETQSFMTKEHLRIESNQHLIWYHEIVLVEQALFQKSH